MLRIQGAGQETYVQASFVYGVATVQHSCRLRGVKEELKADGAVLLHAVLHACVLALQGTIALLPVTNAVIH